MCSSSTSSGHAEEPAVPKPLPKSRIRRRCQSRSRLPQGRPLSRGEPSEQLPRASRRTASLARYRPRHKSISHRALMLGAIREVPTASSRLPRERGCLRPQAASKRSRGASAKRERGALRGLRPPHWLRAPGPAAPFRPRQLRHRHPSAHRPAGRHRIPPILTGDGVAPRPADGARGRPLRTMGADVRDDDGTPP